MTDEAKVEEAKEVDESDDADRVDEANEADGGKFNCFCVVDGFAIFLFLLMLVADVAEAKVADEVDKTGVSIEMPMLEVDEAGVSIEMPLLFVFSLTKYSAIFAEVKGSFGMNNNQLMGFDAAV